MYINNGRIMERLSSGKMAQFAAKPDDVKTSTSKSSPIDRENSLHDQLPENSKNWN